MLLGSGNYFSADFFGRYCAMQNTKYDCVMCKSEKIIYMKLELLG